jgi:hypothetical protein
MTAWTDDELSAIDAADELQIMSRRRDGTLRKPITIWMVRHGDDLYVRSVNGQAAAWFRGTQVSHEGQIRAGGITRDVAFIDADHGIDDQLDAAFRAKYRRYAARFVDGVMTPNARAATLKLVPREEETGTNERS